MKFSCSQEECAFSIIHGDKYECLDLIAKTPEIAKIWTTGLMSLISNHSGMLRQITINNVINVGDIINIMGEVIIFYRLS